MNISLLKLIFIISVILGVIFGLLTLLPYVGIFAFLILITLTSTIVMGILIKNKILQLDSIPESAAIGAIIGFISFAAFSVVYMPFVLVLLKVFKYYTNYGVALALNNSNIFVIIVISTFLAILSAVINAFTGFVFYYVTNLFKDNIK